METTVSPTIKGSAHNAIKARTEIAEGCATDEKKKNNLEKKSRANDCSLRGGLEGEGSPHLPS